MSISNETHGEEHADIQEQRAHDEQASRPERVRFLGEQVKKLFSGEELAPLRERIERSFNVPQWGDYHNEGMPMDTHLLVILKTIKDVREGVFHKDLPKDMHPLFQDIVIRYGDALKRYVFLHDITKADTIRLQHTPLEGEKKSAKVWQGTIEEMRAEYDIPEEVATSPVDLRAWFLENNVSGVSYYHEEMDVPMTERKTTSSKHGKSGAETLRSMGYEGVAPAVLLAIENHEVAYSFKKIKPDTYSEYFSSMSEEEQALALVASYVDTMASFRENGAPDLGDYQSLLGSRKNARIIAAVKAGMSTIPSLEVKKVDTFINGLRKLEVPIDATADHLLERMKKECAETVYDMNYFEQEIGKLLIAEKLVQAEADKLCAMMRAGQAKEIGKTFGPRIMQMIKSAFKST